MIYLCYEDQRLRKEFIDAIMTDRSEGLQHPMNQEWEDPDRFGYPTKTSNNYWIISSWQTFRTAIDPYFEELYEWELRVQVVNPASGGKKLVTQKPKQTVSRLHCGLAVIDECHKCKNVDKTWWRELSHYLLAQRSTRVY